MAWGDTCGKIKLCMPKAGPQLCLDAVNWGGNFNITFRDFTLPRCFILQSGTYERIDDIPITFDGSTSVPIVFNTGTGAAYSWETSNWNTPEIPVTGASATVQFSNGEYGTIIYSVTEVNVLCRDHTVGGEGMVNVSVGVRKFTAEHATATPPSDLSAYAPPNPTYARAWIVYGSTSPDAMVDFNGGLIEIEDAPIRVYNGENADWHPPASPYYITWDLT